MKIKYIHIMILVLVMVPVSILSAAEVQSTTTVASTTVSTADRIKALQDDLRTKIENKKAELKKNITAKKLEQNPAMLKKLDAGAIARVRSNLSVIYDKFTLKINRLSRVDSEVTRKISAVAIISGSATTSSAFVASLNESQKKAKALLTQARIDIEATRSVTLSEIATSTTKDSVRSLVLTAEASIRSAAEAYKSILLIIKPIGKPVPVERAISASSTASSTKNN